MKKIVIRTFVCLLMLSPYLINAQNSYTIDGSSGAIVLKEVKKVTLMGTTDGAVTIETDMEDEEDSDRAKGLRLINPAGLVDNTGIGLSIKEEDGKHVISEVSSKGGNRYTIKVPNGYAVHYECTGVNGGTLEIHDVGAELDVSVNYNSVELHGVTGPLAVHSVYGSIDANFTSVSQSGPSSLYSVYSHVDVSLPASTKANLHLSAAYGDVYSDMEVSYVEDENGMKNLSGRKMMATTNGGGVEFTIKSGYGNVYLRKK